MRSVLKLANQQGVNDIVAQQSTIKKQILAKNLYQLLSLKLILTLLKSLPLKHYLTQYYLANQTYYLVIKSYVKTHNI